MENPNNSDQVKISNFIKEANDKLEKFTSILEKFGLNIITKMGQSSMKMNMLTDKIEELSKATIDVKALLPQLTNVIENQKILEAELDLIRTLIQRSDISFHSKEIKSDIEKDTTATDKKQAIIEQFNSLIAFFGENNDPYPIKERLERIKEDIFIYTGGHRILNEIRQFNSRLDGLNSLSDDIKEELKEKITFWINKLTVKG